MLSQLHFQTVLFLTDSKCLDEVRPIPGYKGFIPHVRTSDVGLGSRFHHMVKEGYDALYAQKAEQEESRNYQCSADDISTVEPVKADRYSVCTVCFSQRCGVLVFCRTVTLTPGLENLGLQLRLRP